MLTARDSLSSLRAGLQAGKFRLLDLLEFYLQNIERNSAQNAYLDVYAEDARKAAKAVEARLAAGEAGPLAGAFIAVKDIIAVQHKRLTCGSKILADYISPYDATVIARLKKADAILLGKTNLDEFAMGSSNENSAFGCVRNPHDEKRVPGGSSGGSAVAVAANTCLAALGTDTGGSIRQPAAFCGVYGLKPTYGRVSRNGLVAFASSLDQIGPLARTPEDLAAILQVIAGADAQDSTCAQRPVPDYRAELEKSHQPSTWTVGLPKEYLSDDLQPEIRAAVRQAEAIFREAGANVIEVSLPLTEYCIAIYYIICTAEASSNLARYDGARYGRRAQGVADLEEMYTRSRSEGFGAEVKRRIMLGTYVLSSGYYDAYYRRALKARTLLRREFTGIFEKCDFLLAPTTPTTAFKIGEKVREPIAMYLSDIFTVSANLTGLPALSVPAGRDGRHLPIGVQLIGKAFEETTLLQAAKTLEQLNQQPDGRYT